VSGPRLPAVPGAPALGVGLDLPWGAPIGFGFDPARGDVAADRVVRFLGRHAGDFSHLFVSWQPRSRSRLDAREYFAAYDDLFARIPPFSHRALHQTAFNLGALEPYDRGAVVELTDALVERYGLAWVNEDLGLWSIRGRPLPYPLPPYLTAAGLRAAVRNTAEVQGRLSVPLLVEFPGFADGTSLTLGTMHAYDFFRRVVEETGSPATLDVGHLLSYQWLRGRRGEELFAELDRLPLDRCFEIHLSGCAIVDGRFLDAHHGVLLDEQLDLLRRLAPRCPHLRAVTYEDPRFDDEGALLPQTAAGFERLRATTRSLAS
jgi:uncharacterized protein (UPF0276 family)